MVDSNDIFNITNLSDLPEDMKKAVESRKYDEFEQKILELFHIANRPLSINEIMVALYRKYNVNKNRRQVMNKLYQMASPSNAIAEIYSIKKGVYNLKQKEASNE